MYGIAIFQYIKAFIEPVLQPHTSNIPVHFHPNINHTHPHPHFPTPTMAKDSAFRICIAILLLIQLTCWALTLLDLLSPGRPTALLRTSVDLVSQVFAKQQPAAVLLYQDFRSRMF